MAGRGPTEAQTQSQAVRLEVLIVHDWAQFPFVFLIWDRRSELWRSPDRERVGHTLPASLGSFLPSFGQCAVTHSGLRCGNCNGE
jgi:hypothetical protein